MRSSSARATRIIGVCGTLPDNKQNHLARWLLAMSDVRSKPIYKERAGKWWQLMKSRM